MTVINVAKFGIIEVATARMKQAGICTVENYSQKLISNLYQLQFVIPDRLTALIYSRKQILLGDEEWGIF